MVGHSPKALKRLFLWLLHEAGMSRNQLCDHLEAKSINANKVLLSAWSGNGNRPRWSVWKQVYKVINELLAGYGLSIEDFTYESTYTPFELQNLRQRSKMSLDDFCRAANEKPQRILLYESDSEENTRGIGFANYQKLMMSVLPDLDSPDPDCLAAPV